MKKLNDVILASAVHSAARIGKTVVACVETDSHDVGTHYVISLSRQELERVQSVLGHFESFEIRGYDLGHR